MRLAAYLIAAALVASMAAAAVRTIQSATDQIAAAVSPRNALIEAIR